MAVSTASLARRYREKLTVVTPLTTLRLAEPGTTLLSAPPNAASPAGLKLAVHESATVTPEDEMVADTTRPQHNT